MKKNFSTENEIKNTYTNVKKVLFQSYMGVTAELFSVDHFLLANFLMLSLSLITKKGMNTISRNVKKM